MVHRSSRNNFARALGTCLLPLSLFCPIATSAAEPEGPPTKPAASEDEADKLYHQGNDALDAGRKEEAYDLYKQAFALKKSFDIAANLGSVELNLNKPRDAAEHLAFSLRLFSPTADQSKRPKVQQLLDEARALVATLRIKVNVAGALVSVDGQQVGQAPIEYEIFVDPGRRVVEARLAEHVTARAEKTLEKGTSSEVELILVKEEQKTDGNGATEKPVVMGLGYGLAGLSLVGGVIFAVLSSSKASEADDKLGELAGSRPCDAPGNSTCPEIQGLRSDEDSFADAAGWMFVGGGALAVATTIYAIVVNSEEEPTSGLTATPILGSHEFGVALALRF